MDGTEKTGNDPQRPPERPEADQPERSTDQPERSSKLGIAPLLGGAAAVTVAIVVVIVLIGGGSDDDGSEEASRADGFLPNVVTDSDIESQEEGSPGTGAPRVVAGVPVSGYPRDYLADQP